jgi:hypothetical protein
MAEYAILMTETINAYKIFVGKKRKKTTRHMWKMILKLILSR